MNKICTTCNREYSNSLVFCLEDGTELIERDDQLTLVITSETGEERPRFEQSQDVEQAIKFGLAELFSDEEFAEFEFDARFERLVHRFQNDDIYKLIGFLRRLLGRAKIAKTKGQSNYDPTAIWEAISADSDEVTDRLLRDRGLI